MRYALSLLLLSTAQPVVAQGLAPVAVSAPHERQLPLQGGRNFRDIGGYRAADGRTVKWGLLYRSGSMHGLTEADYRALEARNIRVVCDFRDTQERAGEPVSWPSPGAPKVLSTDYELDRHFLPAGDPKNWTAEQARSAMTESYPRLLTQFNAQYRRMFAELLAGHAPLAFNCTAGKDRTGIAAALLLTALGVPRSMVIDDYLLTNRYLDVRSLSQGPASPANPLASMSPDAARTLGAADRHYIEAVFAIMDAHVGGATGYLRDELGLSRNDLVKLRNLYLA
ncbi:tyrosine-protein phosphatase [Sphingomonas nostoxanthinifaciens]|uniref:tyrosine-protein phosphatase n=1 Tax=Sphingomonas nostoxanthinifaciens TaxID=2872652 RepID=UPI001CC210C8|nr:tyrosine-protein phosphatase [Sphingomonas nostoxanthinifaciens]UAK26268.1 tyrosine-protein phosphatase [Sphingomonas nostoxanthinifaciens]